MLSVFIEGSDEFSSRGSVWITGVEPTVSEPGGAIGGADPHLLALGLVQTPDLPVRQSVFYRELGQLILSKSSQADGTALCKPATANPEISILTDQQ